MTPPTRIVFTLVACLSALAGASSAADGPASPPAAAPFQPEWESLRRYEVPDWFRDAKFGIFVHWGPQTLASKDAAADGSKTRNWKELAADFRGERFDPDHWADVFQKAGAKYVVQVAEHHDGYALYDSSRTPWTSVKMGPKRDVVAEVAAAVRKRGLVFGASSHTEENWWFYSDPPKKAPLAPAPGRDPGPQPDEAFLDDWYARLVEINEKYHPQIMWFDWCVEQPAYEPYLRKFAAYYYNQAAARGEPVVLNYKYDAFPAGTAVLDVSVGTNRFAWKPEGVRALPWQFDTMSNRKYWFWREGMEVRPGAELIADLADVVSKNGNLLLNVPPAPDGSLTADQEKALAEMGRWLTVNGEAIYGTRPWTVYGEGPTEGVGPGFRERSAQTPYTAADFRFTGKGDVLYAIGLAYPADGKLTIKSLASGAAVAPGEVTGVRLLGRDAPVPWSRGAAGLTVELPAAVRSAQPFVLRIEGSVASRPSSRPAPAPAGAGLPPPGLPLPVTPGQVRASNDFKATTDIAGWRLGKGKWTVEGGALKGVELPEDKHAAGLACPLLYHDAAVRFRFRFAGGHDAVLMLRGESGNIGRVILSPSGITLQKDKPNSPKDTPEKTEVLARAKCRLAAGQWHTVTVVVCGPQFAVRVDGEPTLTGTHAALDVDKTEVEFMAGGDAILFDSLRVWDVRR